jgi:hypothetical protein
MVQVKLVADGVMQNEAEGACGFYVNIIPGIYKCH